MSSKIIDGKALSQHIKNEIRAKVATLKTRPGLAVILAGHDPASQTYVNSKEKACAEVGFYSEIHRLPEDVSEKEIITLVNTLNKAPNIHGLLVQLPLPKQCNADKINLLINPQKDVDGFHPYNTGQMFNGDFSGMLPCTPAGCLELIKTTGVNLAGKKAVVVGRSNIVGKPVALLLLNENCTVTICHSKTKNLAEEIKQADIVVAAIGRPGMITGDMIKPGAIVIDVGINRIEGKLCGDVEYASAKEVADWITPVPGGVGPMTIAMLLQNTLRAQELYGR